MALMTTSEKLYFIDSNGLVWEARLDGNAVCVSERIPSAELALTDDDKLMLAGMKICPD